MKEGATDRLSAAQKDCLRLVGAGLEIKEIARELGISPTAVVERLRAARAILGVSSSRAAARLLAVQEQPATYMRHVDMPYGVAEHAIMSPFSFPSADESGPAGNGPGGVSIREEQTPYQAGHRPAGSRFPWPFPTAGRERNDLTVLQCLIAVLALTVGLSVAALAAIAIVDQLSRIRLG